MYEIRSKAMETEGIINEITENVLDYTITQKHKETHIMQLLRCIIMKIFDELKGKEVIDAKGNKEGNISDVGWNPETNKIESIIVTEGRGPSAKIGRGEKRIIPYEKVHSIGDKVLLKE